MGNTYLNKKPEAEDCEYVYAEDSTGAIVRVKKSSIVAMGKDGGYYTPTVDENGNLTWAASEEGMPEIEGGNVKGPKGDTPVKGEDYFTEDDKAELVEIVLKALPAAEEVAW